MKIIKSKFILLLLFSVFLIIPANISTADTFEDKVSDISSELMCPVCRGQTVSESNSDLANDFREIIKTKLREGQSKEEILNYFTSRYGDTVLASPPARGFRLIVWILPIVVIGAGFIFLSMFLRSNRNKDRGNSTPEDDKYLDKVDEELNKID